MRDNYRLHVGPLSSSARVAFALRGYVREMKSQFAPACDRNYVAHNKCMRACVARKGMDVEFVRMT
jgi:hypothetical protein